MLKPEIRSLQTGDRFMWDCAFHFLWPVAWSAAQRRMGTIAPGDVEDVAISAIREAAEKVQAGNVASFEELKALTAIIATRRALDHIRRMQAERRSQGMTETLELRADQPSTAPGPVEQADGRDLARVLLELASQLPVAQRELLTAFYLEGLKQKELAERFGMKLGTVGVTLSRALKSVREQIEKYPQLMKELLEALR